MTAQLGAAAAIGEDGVVAAVGIHRPVLTG
jgi:hypothetical protein